MEPDMKITFSTQSLSLRAILTRTLILSTMLGLSACGGSDDQPEQSKSYIQFYNAAATSANPEVRLDDASISSARFANATNVIAVDSASPFRSRQYLTPA